MVIDGPVRLKGNNLVGCESRVRPMASGEGRCECDFDAMYNIAVRHGYILISRHPRNEPDRLLATPYLEADSIVRVVLRG